MQSQILDNPVFKIWQKIISFMEKNLIRKRKSDNSKIVKECEQVVIKKQ